MLRIERDSGPLLTGVAAGSRHLVDCRQAFFVEELPGDSQALTQVRRTNEQGINPIDGGDRFTFVDRLQSLDLNRHKRLFVGPSSELRSRNGREPGVPAPGIQAPISSRRKF